MSQLPFKGRLWMSVLWLAGGAMLLAGVLAGIDALKIAGGIWLGFGWGCAATIAALREVVELLEKENNERRQHAGGASDG